MGNILALISHGSEYISTDIYPYHADEVLCTLEVDRLTIYAHYFGVATGNSRLGIQANNQSTGLIMYAYGAQSSTIPASSLVGLKKTYLCSGSSMYVDSEMQDGILCNKPLVVFAGYFNGSIESGHGIGKFYGLKILDTQSSAVKNELVPWLDDNNVPCIKDLKTNSLYYNAGDGSFGYIDLDGTVHDNT